MNDFRKHSISLFEGTEFATTLNNLCNFSLELLCDEIEFEKTIQTDKINQNHIGSITTNNIKILCYDYPTFFSKTVKPVPIGVLMYN